MIDPIWESKCWGRVYHAFANDRVAISYLETRRATRCSLHYHRHRSNLFIVIAGRIVVEQWVDPEAGHPESMAILDPGDRFLVLASIWHRFRVVKSGIVVEVYWTDDGCPVSIDDIVRHDVGGNDVI